MLTNKLKAFWSLAFFFSFIFSANATVYTTISDGSYNNCTIWDNGCPNNNIQQGDTVIINHVVNANSSMNVQGTLILGANGVFNSSNTLEITAVGIFINQGNFTTDNTLNINGTFFNEAIVTAPSVYTNGYICNSGTISLTEEFYAHGALVDCGGTVETCEFNMNSNNNAVDVTGSATAELFNQNLCCTDPGFPSPFGTLDGDYVIDSAGVSFCSLPIQPDAGIDISTSSCEGVSEINLYSLLSSDVDPNGTFSEVNPTGSLDPSTGIFTTAGLSAGTYTFIYTVAGYNASSDESEIEITINPVIYSVSELVACSSDLPVEWNGLSLNEEGSHSVTLMSVNTGCDSVATLDLSVTFLDAPTLSSSGPVQCSGDLIEITIEDIPNAEFHWNGPNGYFSEEAYNEFELNYTNEGTYTAYYSLNSCVSEVAELELGIENFEIDEFTFPNVITANNDGVNDEITVEDYIGYCEEFNFSIRDRWGNQVFEQERGEESFNGVSFVGEKLPEGVYFYHLSYGMKSLSGFIHIFE